MSDYQQEPPYCVQVEATEGCNLRCGFCGIRGIREAGDRDNLSGPYHFMAPATARLLARQIAEAGWNPRIEFAMHGEPTMNPNLPRIIRTMREYLPQQSIMVTTNGIPLLNDWERNVRGLFDAGADTIAVDDYKPYRCRDAVLSTRIPGVTVLRHPDEGQRSSPHRRPRRGEKRLILVEALDEANIGNHSHISNHAGAAYPPSDAKQGQRCALPFRELSIRWDGNAALCCNDWRGAFKIGGVHSDGVVAMWHSEAMQAARRFLYHGQRVFSPCQGCTHTTYRNGLLPDKKGKVDLGMPTQADAEAVSAALDGPFLTEPVPRKWEMENGVPK